MTWKRRGARDTPKAQEGKASREYWYPDLNDQEWSLLNRTMNRQFSTSQNYIDEATKWLYADEKGVKVFAIYGIGDGTEPTVLYAVGGARAQTLNQRRIEYENDTKRSARNPYKKNLERLGIQQNQQGNGVNNNGHNEHETTAGFGQVLDGERRGYNGGAASGNSQIKSAKEAKESGEVNDAHFSIEFAEDIAENQRAYVERGNAAISADELEAGDQTLIFMNDVCYLVECFDDALNYYQVEDVIACSRITGC